MNDPIKILIADDNGDFAGLLNEILNKEEDMTVVGIAKDGLQTLELINILSPDIVVLDIIMPNLDGIGVLERLASVKNSTKPLFIMLSAIGQDAFVQKAITLGAEYYLVKPFDINILLKRIRQIHNEKNMSWFSNMIPDMEDARQDIIHDKSTEVQVTNFIRDAGIPAHMSGYQYLREAIILTLNNNNNIRSVTKALYPEVAEKFSTSPQKVERAIRNAIESAWLKGNTSYLDSIFGSSASFNKGRPSNSEFIAIVAERIKMSHRRRY
ncbi:MAG: sporulation transcription factor Spo0A [Bacillota bacterium]|nr:sporulation transcription factor Spo0A [Bacillota bacterium]